ncbi:MAG: hypothetical protein GY820_38625 [Gammaproteobacteria bacterium]|nr:hypothetical protein [Gammaproteobacteria bacterium]
MAFELNGFSDAILGQLSQIGIEIWNDKSSDRGEELIPKAIYEMSKQTKKAKDEKPTP